MKIQPFLHADLIDIDDLRPDDWQSLYPPYNFYLHSPFCHPIKVSIDDRLIGIGTTIVHGDTAWLAHIVVHPDYRNQQIGAKITQALIDSLQATPCETIYLKATEQGEPVYRKLGFEFETSYPFFRGGHIDVNTPITPNVKPFEDKFREALLTLDREVSGENRSYRLVEHFPKALIFEENGQLQGFYLPAFGDGLIIAKHPDAGIELMKERLKSNLTAILPIDNQIAIDFLQQHHYSEFRQAKRMRLGKKRPWQPENIFNRVAGKLG